jgi:hypothetical protein
MVLATYVGRNLSNLIDKFVWCVFIYHALQVGLNHCKRFTLLKGRRWPSSFAWKTFRSMPFPIEWDFLIFSIYLDEECCFSVWNHESNWRLGSEIYGIRCHCTPSSEKFIMSIRSNLNFFNTVLEIILNISRLPSNHTSTLPNYFWTSVCCLVSQTPRQLRIRNVLTSVSRLYIFN